jgi:hypothetical protein
MRSASGLLLALLPLVLPPLTQPAGPAGSLSGRFYERESSLPIAGALVALYEKATGLLIDSTYTRDTGDFTLRPPPRGGAFYLVATKGALSRRRDLIYDPIRPAMDVSITDLPSLTRWARFGQYLSGKVEAVGSFVLGLFGGWLFNFLTSRWAARQKAVNVLKAYLQELNAEVNEAVEGLKADLAALPTHWNQVSEASYLAIMAKMVAATDDIERQLHAKSIEEDLYEIRGRRGLDKLIAFRHRLRGVRDAIKPPADLSGARMKKSLEYLQAQVRDLELQPLLRG